MDDPLIPLYNNDKPQDDALNELIDLKSGERDLLRRLLKNYMAEEIERANLYFDHFIEQTRIRIGVSLTILHKISKSSKKFNESMEEKRKNPMKTIDLDDD